MPTPLPAQDWCRSFQAACDAIPKGRMYQWLSAQWLEQQLAMRPGAPTANVQPTLRVELQRVCARAAMELRLHADFRVVGQAAAISAALMLDLHRLLNEDLTGPLNRMLVDRIHAEFRCTAPDWSELTLPSRLNEALLAMALTRSVHSRPKPPVRFAVDLVSGRTLPLPASSGPAPEPQSGR